MDSCEALLSKDPPIDLQSSLNNLNPLLANFK